MSCKLTESWMPKFLDLCLEGVERLCHATLARELIPLDNGSWKEREKCVISRSVSS